MIRKTCPKCQSTFNLADARLDKHWNTWSAEPAYAYCPQCNARLDGVHFDSVDLARHLTPTNVLLVFIWFGLFAIGIATERLEYVGPVMIALFGLRLARTSSLRDHRIVGWFLVVVSGVSLYAFTR